MRKSKSEVLHASLKEQPLLLSIIQNPSSTPKINKCLYTILLKKNKNIGKGERRGRLLAQRGEARKSTGVLTSLLKVEKCLCSCMPSLGYYLSLLAAE